MFNLSRVVLYFLILVGMFLHCPSDAQTSSDQTAAPPGQQTEDSRKPLLPLKNPKVATPPATPTSQPASNPSKNSPNPAAKPVPMPSSLAEEGSQGVPNLLIIVAVGVGTYYLIAFTHFIFNEVGRGSITFAGFEQEWADPTYKIIRFMIIAFALVLMFPYLRTVEKLLIEAAKATENVRTEPAPFVFVTSLDDFFVSHQINAYTSTPHSMAQIYADLHKNILDKFNEAGVEIMSPHYTSLRDGNEDALPAKYRGENPARKPFPLH